LIAITAQIYDFVGAIHESPFTLLLPALGQFMNCPCFVGVLVGAIHELPLHELPLHELRAYSPSYALTIY
jgi:hypothetical protein